MTLFVPGGVFRHGNNTIIVVELFGRSNQAEFNILPISEKTNFKTIKFIKEPIYEDN